MFYPYRATLPLGSGDLDVLFLFPHPDRLDDGVYAIHVPDSPDGGDAVLAVGPADGVGGGVVRLGRYVVVSAYHDGTLSRRVDTVVVREPDAYDYLDGMAIPVEIVFSTHGLIDTMQRLPGQFTFEVEDDFDLDAPALP